jgi:DNA polymerase-3 subunit alpha
VEECAKLAVSYRDILDPGCFFLELMDHGLPEQQEVIKVLLEVSRRTGIPVVATNDCHFVKKEDAEAQDVRICIATDRRIDDKDRPRSANPESYFKSPDEMAALFSYAPEAVANTMRIAEMCRLEIPMGKESLPEAAVPVGQSHDSFLEGLCAQGLEERFRGEVPIEYADRLRFELSIIRRKELSGCFLIFRDLVDCARGQGIPVGPGRGAAPGSLVNYALEITNIDPIKHGLLFERFINPESKTLPDIDIDFGDAGRDQVIEHARRRYGANQVAHVITFGSFNARLAVTETARALNLPSAEFDRLFELIPSIPLTRLEDAIRDTPELSRAAQDQRIKKLLEVALKLEGLKRCTGVHAASVVISREPLLRCAPLCRGRSGRVMTQYGSYPLMDLGLFQIDLLSLRILSVMDDAAKAISSQGNPDFSFDTVPLDDPMTFQLMSEGRTFGVFQLDSAGMQDLLKRLKPTSFEDVISAIALYRPGPMKAGMVDAFIERKHGREKITSPHPLVGAIIKDTYGCILYQEQIMKISKELAGFTPGEADSLRKAMSKRNPEDLAMLRERFVKGCTHNTIGPKTATVIYEQMEKFGGYGFNKSHAAAYGLIAYQAAYLKAHHPAEFMAALVKNETYAETAAAYIAEAKGMGVTIAAPPSRKEAVKIDEERELRSVTGTITELKVQFTKKDGLSWAKGVLKAGNEEVAFIVFPKVYSHLKQLFVEGTEMTLDGIISRTEGRPEELVVRHARQAQI